MADMMTERGARPTPCTPPAVVGALALLLAAPWLWPWTPGPSAAVAPLLGAWACLAGAMALLAAPGASELSLRQAWPASLQVAALVSAAIGLLQWFGAAPGVWWVSPADLGEAYGNLRQRNQFASLLNLGLAAVVWRPWPHRAAQAAAVVLLAAANAASASRTGALGLLLLGAAALLWPDARKRRLGWLALAAAAYLAALLALPALMLQWRGIEAQTALSRAISDLGCSSRSVLWSNVLDLVAHAPWTGWGWGELDYAHYQTLYTGARFCDILDNAHNLPLHLAVELGVPVAILACAAAAAAAWRLRPWACSDPHAQLAWAVMGLVGLHSLLEYPLWYGPFQIAMLAACCLVAPAGGRLLAHRRWMLGAAAALALGVASAALSYARVSQAYLPAHQRLPAYRHDPVGAVGRSLFFQDALDFARLSVTVVDRTNAAQVHALALRLLHFSPEPAVIEKVIDSALLLGLREQAAWHEDRYAAAFPAQHAQWAAQRRAGGLPTR